MNTPLHTMTPQELRDEMLRTKYKWNEALTFKAALDELVARASAQIPKVKPQIPANAVVRENYGINSVSAQQYGFPEGFAGRCHVAHSKMQPVHVRVVLADAVEVVGEGDHEEKFA